MSGRVGYSFDKRTKYFSSDFKKLTWQVFKYNYQKQNSIDLRIKISVSWIIFYGRFFQEFLSYLPFLFIFLFIILNEWN